MRLAELDDGELEESKGLEIVRVRTKRVIVGAGARILFYPTLLYNVFRNKIQAEFRWWDQVDQFLLLGAVPFPTDVPRLQQLGVRGVITLNEPYETLVPSSLYQEYGIDHLVIPTRDYLFAPSPVDICRAVDFIHRNTTHGRTTYVHCKAGRGRSTTIVLCYLIEYRNMTPATALEYVRSRRPRVQLAPSQWQAVQEYSKHKLEYPAIQSPPRAIFPGADAVLLTEADLEGYGNIEDTFEDRRSICSGRRKVRTRSARLLPVSLLTGDEVLITDADLEDTFEDGSIGSRRRMVRTGSARLLPVSPLTWDGVLITDADLEDTFEDGSICSQRMVRTRSARLFPVSPLTGDEVMITDADLEGYDSDEEAYKDLMVSSYGIVHSKPVIARLSCIFSSLKLSSSCPPVAGQLPEIPAC